MIQFTLEVDTTPDNISYVKHLVKGVLRALDSQAKVFDVPTKDQSWFEEIERQEFEAGRLSL